MKPEDQLQVDVVVEFSQRYPERRGQLFHVPNERNSDKQAFGAKAKGIFPGVSDLIYFGSFHVKGIELKAPGTRHKVLQIELQIEWGKILEYQFGFWRLCTTVEQVMNFVNGDYELDTGLTIREVEKRLSEVKTKTIKF